MTLLNLPPGTEPRRQASDIDRFGRTLRGALILQDHPEYEVARKVWNGMVDKRPSMIVRCADAGDVATAVDFARDHGLRVAVRGGGHNLAGSAVCDDGLVIDLSAMKRIEVDADRRIARAQAGLNLGEFDAATQAFGLATTMGVNGDTGISGLTLGGGFGKLGRKYGLACDNLLAAEVVTADGALVTANASENPDLFWGLRGGGGNFGVVTRFEYRLHPVGPTVLAGSVLYDWAQAREALRFYAEFSSRAPDELSADAVLMTSPEGERLFGISVCWCGDLDEGARVLEPLQAHRPPLEVGIAPTPYLQVQSASDRFFSRGRRYYWKAQFLREISDSAIDALLEAYASAPSVSALAVLQQVGGAIARVPPSATAYAQRDAAYDCFPVAIWDDPAEDEANIRWARELWTALRPFSTGGVYVNNLGDEGEDRVRAAYGENYARLVALKTRYDPSNLFRLNQNIRPTVR
jgi:FAD/FMN-containing dehydrogenase